jgi:hypothetical protein
MHQMLVQRAGRHHFAFSTADMATTWCWPGGQQLHIAHEEPLSQSVSAPDSTAAQRALHGRPARLRGDSPP